MKKWIVMHQGILSACQKKISYHRLSFDHASILVNLANTQHW